MKDEITMFKLRWALKSSLILLLLSPLARPQAATLTVANSNDSGTGSLRQAILNAHHGDIISIDFGGTIKLNSEILVNKSVTITCLNEQVHLALDGQNKVRTLHVTGETVSVNNIDVQNGNSTGDPSVNFGGGILVGSGANFTLHNSFVRNNTAQLGGGIFVAGSLAVTNSTIALNNASNGAGVYGPRSVYTNCIFAFNRAGDQGGGYYNGAATGDTFLQCVIVHNMATTGPAGFGAANFLNCTLTGNSRANVQSTSNGLAKAGNQAINVSNTILANGSLNCGSPVTSQGYNLSDDASCFNGQSPATDVVNTDPQLGDYNVGYHPIGQGGGLTILPKLGSPVVDAGNPTCCTDTQGQPLTQDAFRFSRLRDGNHDHTTRVDIGALEFQPSPIIWSVSPQSSDSCNLQHPSCLRVQETVDAAYEGDILQILAGNYSEGITISKHLSLIGYGKATILGKTGKGATRLFTLSSDAVVTLDNLTMSHSSSLALFSGGAISNSGNLTLRHCTLSDNRSDQNGGAILNSGTLDMKNCTVSSNRAQNSGGGIYNTTTGSATINFCTFSGNTAFSTAATARGTLDNHGTMTLKNTIIGNSPDVTNCTSTVTSLGHNLSSDATCGGNFGDIPNADPQLGPLQDNGGDTFTYAFSVTSPAYNAGDGSIEDFSGIDQRGLSRVTYTKADIGAAEMVWPGDFDGNGAVDAEDVSAMLYLFLHVTPNAVFSKTDLIIVDLRPKPGTNGRPTGDGAVRSDDLNAILRIFLGLEQP